MISNPNEIDTFYAALGKAVVDAIGDDSRGPSWDEVADIGDATSRRILVAVQDILRARSKAQRKRLTRTRV